MIHYLSESTKIRHTLMLETREKYLSLFDIED